MIHRSAVAAYALQLLALATFAQAPRVTTVTPIAGADGDIVVQAEYVPVDAKNLIVALHGQSTLKTSAVAGGASGLVREYHARIPKHARDDEYRVYLHYDGLPAPGLVAPVALRIVSPIWLATYPWVFGMAAVALGILIAMTETGRDIRKLWRGADGKPSTSKFQFALWTAVILFVFTTIAGLYLANKRPIDTDAPCSLPQNIWIVLGLSGVTAVAAKGITVGNINSGRLTQQQSTEGGLITSDSGDPELFKIQLLTWTVVAIGTYLAQFISAVALLGSEKLTTAPACHVPDIDTTLMVLMGLSQGTYLGKKLVTTDTPRITSITPSSGVHGTSIDIVGAAFGDAQLGSLITIDNQSLRVPASWTDGLIRFTLPPSINGGLLAPGPHTIALIVNGRGSVGSVFVLMPNLKSVTPDPIPHATVSKAVLSLAGDTFGDVKGVVLIDESPVQEFKILSWTNELVTVKLDSKHPSGDGWRSGPFAVTIVANNTRSKSFNVTLK